MVKFAVILLSIVAFAMVAAQEARTVREKNVNDGSGNFQFT